MKSLQANKKGLTSQEAQERLEKYGYNELVEKKRRTALQMFLSQFKDIFILLLIMATVFSAIIGYYEWAIAGVIENPIDAFANAIIIGIIVVLVGVVGFIQEFRAEKALDALKKLTAPTSSVIRDGKEVVIPSREVVPGDILVLESGARIPADARIIEAIEFRTNEAVLTGESAPVNKKADSLAESTSTFDRSNMVFTGTHIVYGRGSAVVTSTGMNTEFGKIAELVQTAETEETPLQKKLDRFAKLIGKIVVGVVAVIFSLEIISAIVEGQLQIQGFINAFMSSIALAISAVPEGLPAIVTIGLALGAREFAKRNAVVRRLSSAESLGAVTYICSDKTGTITKGEMTVRQVYVDGKTVEVTGVGYEPKGEFRQGGEVIKPDGDLELLLKVGTLCNNAQLRQNEEDQSWEIIGDPTEAALIVCAGKAGFTKTSLEQNYPRVSEIPFTSERKLMTTIHKNPEKGLVVFVKGAPEVIVERCTFSFVNGNERKLTKEQKKEILSINESLAGNALRVLAMAYKNLPAKTHQPYTSETAEENLVFMGLVGMIDPPRKEAVEANRKSRQAGIKTVMITGDHKLTAVAIAKEVEMLKEGDLSLTGAELEEMSDKEFEKIVENVAVYARVSPEHKLRIVKALKAKGNIVAMTGDGVNDAPAIKTADVGVAMGITGTDVTKEASDLVLIDDNFATIVKAVEQGRVIYDNIRKYVRFLIAANFDELLVIGLFAILGSIFGSVLFPLPLTAAMILFINLVTDGLPAIALGTDLPEGDVMERPPRPPDAGILHGMGRFVLVSFLLQSIGTILTFSLFYYVFPADPLDPELTLRVARTAAFLQAALFELFVVWNCRSETRSVWSMGRDAFKNKFFVIATLTAIALTIGVVYIPITQQLFGLEPLNLTQFGAVTLIASWGLFVFPSLLMGKKLWRWE